MHALDALLQRGRRRALAALLPCAVRLLERSAAVDRAIARNQADFYRADFFFWRLELGGIFRSKQPLTL